MGAATNIFRFGAAIPLIIGGLSALTGRDNADGGPVAWLGSILGDDGIGGFIKNLGVNDIAAQAGGEALPAITAFVGSLMMPAVLGKNVKNMSMSVAGLVLAGTLLKGAYTSKFNGQSFAGLDLSNGLDWDSLTGGSDKPAETTPAENAFLESLTQISAPAMQGDAVAKKVMADAEAAAAHVHKASADATAALLADLKRPLTREEINAAINNMDAFGADVQDIDGVFEHGADENVPIPEVFAELKNDEVA